METGKIINQKAAKLLWELNLTSLIDNNYEYGWDDKNNLTTKITDIVYPAPNILDCLLILKNLGYWITVDHFMNGTLWTSEISIIGNSNKDGDLKYILEYDSEENKSFYDPLEAYQYGITYALFYHKQNNKDEKITNNQMKIKEP